jgi:hypothetical protein
VRAGCSVRVQSLHQVVSEPEILSVYLRREKGRRKGKHSDTHDLRQVVSEREDSCSIAEKKRRHHAAQKRKAVTLS